MKVFFATFPHQHEALNARRVRRRLLSYNDLRAPKVLRKLEAASSVAEALGIEPIDGRCKDPNHSAYKWIGGQELMLDSGAYSAWKRGAVITIEEYIAFVLKYGRSFAWIVNLDQIPGAWRQKPVAAEVDRSAEIGWENFYALKQALGPEQSAKLIHVYHQGEHRKWRTKILDEGGDYIGISPGNDRGHRRGDWLDIVKPHLTDDKGRALRKFHAFGVTAPEILGRHLWLYSADSTSWARAAQFGNCYIAVPPARVGANYFVDGVPVPKARTISFSRRRTDDRQHFDRLSASDQAVVVAYLRRVGIPEVTMQPLRIAKKLRAEVNIQYFLNMEHFLDMAEREMGRFVVQFVRTDRPVDTSLPKALS
jgi:hypothetical protein